MHVCLLDSVPRTSSPRQSAASAIDAASALGSTDARRGNAARWRRSSRPTTVRGTPRRRAQAQRRAALQPGHGDERVFRNRDGLYQQLELIRSGPSRAITTGQIGLFGEIDPTDGGDTSRFSLSARLAQSDDVGSVEGECLPRQRTLNLWNNFTYFLDRSHERRSVPPA